MKYFDKKHATIKDLINIVVVKEFAEYFLMEELIDFCDKILISMKQNKDDSMCFIIGEYSYFGNDEATIGKYYGYMKKKIFQYIHEIGKLCSKNNERHSTVEIYESRIVAYNSWNENKAVSIEKIDKPTSNQIKEMAKYTKNDLENLLCHTSYCYDIGHDRYNIIDYKGNIVNLIKKYKIEDLTRITKISDFDRCSINVFQRIAKKYDIPLTISDNSSKFKSMLDLMLDLITLRDSLLNENEQDDKISKSSSLLEL